MKKALILAIAILTIGLNASGQRKNCKGVTKAGIACKSTIIDKSGYCRSHSPNAIKCAGETKAKKPCGMIVTKKGDYCKYHKP